MRSSARLRVLRRRGERDDSLAGIVRERTVLQWHPEAEVEPMVVSVAEKPVVEIRIDEIRVNLQPDAADPAAFASEQPLDEVEDRRRVR